MRLPYEQIAMEIIEVSAPELGANLVAYRALLRPIRDTATRADIAKRCAGWGVLELIKWALARCPDNQPPSSHATVKGVGAAQQISLAAGYPGDPEEYVRVASSLTYPILELVPGGIRIKGLDRYDPYWGKCFPKLWADWKAKHPDMYAAPKDRAGTGPEPARSRDGAGPPDPDPDPDSKDASPPPPPDGGGGSKHVAMTPDAQAFWDERVVPRRRSRGLKTGEPPRAFAGWYVACRSEGLADQQLDDALGLFMADPDFSAKGWPVAVFIKPNVYRWRLRERPELAFEFEARRQWDQLSPAGRAFSDLLQRLEHHGSSYALHQVQSKLVPELRGEQLVLLTTDRFQLEWFRENYAAVVAPAVFDVELAQEAA